MFIVLCRKGMHGMVGGANDIRTRSYWVTNLVMLPLHHRPTSRLMWQKSVCLATLKLHENIKKESRSRDSLFCHPVFRNVNTNEAQ